MKASAALFLALVAAAAGTQAAAMRDVNPLSKVIELLSSLEAKIIKEGEAELKAYDDYVEWCDDASKNKEFEIKTAKAKVEKLTADIEKAAVCIEDSNSKIAELAGEIATGEAELKNATLIREKENADFVAAEAELMDGTDTLERAIALIEREMAKNPALMQVDTTNVQKLAQSIGAVMDAAAFASSDRKKLLALVQSKDGSASADEAEARQDEALLGAPDAAVYKSHSASIVDVLEDMLEKAKGELADLRKAETSSQHNFEMLAQSLEDQKAADEKDKADSTAELHDCSEAKATGEGDKASTVKDLADAEAALATAQSTCMQVATDHQASMTARAEELKALATAKKALTSSTSGAEGHTYSFLQVASVQEGAVVQKVWTRATLANAEVVNLIKRLARQEHSTALAQLASKISAVLKFGAASGEDPFAKVKGLIQDLINRLMAEAASEANEKAYCDEEMAKTEEKKGDLEDTLAKLTSKIDKSTAASAALKAQVKELQEELAALAKQQAQMDKIRLEENADFLEAKADLGEGLDGVRKAIGILREYYGGSAFLLQDEAKQPPLPEKHEKATGAGSSVIGLLEVVESDFAKELAERETAEEEAENEYQTMTQENKITKTLKDQDVKYKTQEYKALDKAISELSSDRETTNTELSAVLEYYAKIKERCIAKPETYEERKKRREAEIAGLKEALKILESETAFVQRPRAFRR